jgi:hypothetical protein
MLREDCLQYYCDPSEAQTPNVKTMPSLFVSRLSRHSDPRRSELKKKKEDEKNCDKRTGAKRQEQKPIS